MKIKKRIALALVTIQCVLSATTLLGCGSFGMMGSSSSSTENVSSASSNFSNESSMESAEQSSSSSVALEGTWYTVGYNTDNKYYTVIGETMVKEGEDYTFTIEVKGGYTPAENFTVLVNNTPVRMNGMSYTVQNVQEDLFITARNFLQNKYTVRFIAGSTILQSKVLEYGKIPEFVMSEAMEFPKDYPDNYVGAFLGWSDTPDGERTSFKKVEGDTDYYAKMLKLPKYADTEDFVSVHYTGATQENTMMKDATLCQFKDAHHPYDGKVFLLIGEHENEACLEYTINWKTTNYAELLSDNKALSFAFSANYTDYVLTIEDKQIVMDKQIYEVKIQNGVLHLNGDSFTTLPEDVYDGTRAMHWEVRRSTVHKYAQFGISDVGIIE